MVCEDHSEVFDYNGEEVRTRYLHHLEDVIFVANGIHKGRSFPPPDLVSLFLEIYHPDIVVQPVHVVYFYDVLITSDHFNDLFTAFDECFRDGFYTDE